MSYLHKQSILFVGSQYLGHKPDDGETMKNQVLSNAFERLGLIVYRIDVRNRWQRLFYLIKYLLCLIFIRDAKLIFSASSFVTYPMLKIAKSLGWNGRSIYYWVIGGNYANYVEEGRIPPDLYLDLRQIIVEGKPMKMKLERLGYNNVMILPNFKDIDYIPDKPLGVSSKIKFVFLSRVMPQKGVDYILDAAKKLTDEGCTNFSVDIYGRIDPGYEKDFLWKIKQHRNVFYKGFLNLEHHSGYDTLASYDIMLFPTYWEGEGFPGIIIDAFIAGLPIIATDWNLNRSLIKNEENGLVIPVHDVPALASSMRNIIDGSVDIKRLSDNCKKSASLYDANMIVNKELLASLGIVNS